MLPGVRRPSLLQNYWWNMCTWLAAKEFQYSYRQGKFNWTLTSMLAKKVEHSGHDCHSGNKSSTASTSEVWRGHLRSQQSDKDALLKSEEV